MERTEIAKTLASQRQVRTSPYGHRLSAMTGKIDLLLYGGRHTVIAIAQELQCSIGRVLAHMAKLRQMGFFIKRTPDGILSVQSITVKRKPGTKVVVSKPLPIQEQQSNKSPYGHRSGTMAYDIDVFMHEFFASKGEWPALPVVAEKLKIPISSVSAHVNYFRKRERYG